MLDAETKAVEILVSVKMIIVNRKFFCLNVSFIILKKGIFSSLLYPWKYLILRSSDSVIPGIRKIRLTERIITLISAVKKKDDLSPYTIIKRGNIDIKKRIIPGKINTKAPALLRS